MNHFLVSVDPGVHLFGAALWCRSVALEKVWVLCRAKLIPFEHDGDLSVPVAALKKWTGSINWDLAIELPQVYRRSRSKGRPSDLIDLAVVVGALASACPGEATMYKPAQWKGGVPKPARKSEPYPIEERCRRKLSEEEISHVELPGDWRKCMDVWDAVGIGLRHLRNKGLRP